RAPDHVITGVSSLMPRDERAVGLADAALHGVFTHELVEGRVRSRATRCARAGGRSAAEPARQTRRHPKMKRLVRRCAACGSEQRLRRPQRDESFMQEKERANRGGLEK